MLITFARAHGNHPAPPQSVEEARKDLYFLKLVDILWFDDSLPTDPSNNKTIYLNFEWPVEPPPRGISGLNALEEHTLSWLSLRMKRPKWADEQHLVRNFGLSDLLNTTLGSYFSRGE